eukprot:5805343-Pyramimonas_sp.AAC.1
MSVTRSGAIPSKFAKRVVAYSAMAVQRDVVRPRFGVSSLAFDETMQKLSLDVPVMKQHVRLAWM